MNEQPMVELVEVSKRFGSFTAVSQVSLSVRRGEFLTLLGPSGCGKTTLLRMISGFETPSEGKVLLDGQDVTAQPPYRRDINQVFQSYALFPHLSVRENIAFGLRMRKTPPAERENRVEEAIAMVGLGGMEGRKPAQLSGGQRQRVALARALVCRPKVLLLDEPLAALDAKLRRAMQIELKRLQQQVGITFLFVTHDQDEAMVMSDRIAVVNAGRIEQLGSAAAIYHRPATRFVADFLGQTNLLPVKVVGRNGDWVDLLLNDEIPVRVAATTVGNGSLMASIRPEKIRLLRSADGEGSIAATVEEELFRGPVAQLTLKMARGQRLAVLITNGSSTEPPLRKGDAVFCSLHGDDVVLLEEL